MIDATPSRNPAPGGRGGCAAVPLVGLLVVAACLGSGQFFALIAGLAFAGTPSWAFILAFAVPLLLALAVSTARTRDPRRRAMFRTWLMAAGYPILMIPATLPRPVEQQGAVLLQIGLTAVYLLFLLVVLRRGSADSRRGRGSAALPAALLAAAPLAYPWTVLGALGWVSDVALSLAAGLLFGAAAAVLIARSWLAPRAESGPRGRSDRLTDGVVVGVTLAIMASNFGFHGAALPMVLVMPCLGWLALAVAEAGGDDSGASGVAALAVLVGLTAAFPLLFSDTDVLGAEALFGQTEGIHWALRAALVSALLALVLPVLVRRVTRVGVGGATRLAAAFAWLGAVLLYLLAGHPGLYGDRLFVVLKEQPDVSADAGTADYAARRRAVYSTLTERASATQAGLRSRLDGLRVGYTPYYLVNALEVNADPAMRWWLESRPEVDRVLPSPRLRPLPRPSAPQTGSEAAPAGTPWNVEQVRAPSVWREFGARGAGIVIGQSDSGVAWDHPELRAGYRGLQSGGGAANDYNWFDPWNGTREPTDEEGHGTHTLGIALGRSVGVAPEATWIGCTNLARNIGNPAVYLDCMQFMLAPFPIGGDPFRDGDPARSANVLNNSWGCPRSAEGCDPDSLRPAVRALRAAGIFVVASAGNDGPACQTLREPIAIYPEALTVGAVDRTGTIADFSSTGPVTSDGSGRIKPDVVAPGVDIVSAFPGNTYYQGSGTSQAGPHVAGVVALLWSAEPSLIGDVDRTERLLTRSATPYRGGMTGNADACAARTNTRTVPNPVAGYGQVDAYRAVQMARAGE